MTGKTSRISGFYRLGGEERLGKVKEFADLTDEEVNNLKKGLSLELAEHMVENVISTLKTPLGIAVNFLINDRDYLIPMATEESSVVAAASNAAKICRLTGGFVATSTEPLMIGQIQLITPNPREAKKIILGNKERILKIANEQDPTLIRFGGGAVDLEVRILKTKAGSMVISHLLVDVRDAMGANIVNTMAEAVSPLIEEVTGGKTLLKIISNYSVRRLSKAEVTVGKDEVGGEEVVDGIINAYEFAASDPYRAVTHNKGVMNGITAVALATGNDTRAVEAGAHAYAARDNGYKPLTTWERDEKGDLRGCIELPLAVGIIGGATMNPTAKTALKILGVESARELSEVMASAGLAQNLAALRVLVSEGIQRGHMSLHARNIAVMAGARGEDVDRISGILVKEKNIRVDRAKELLNQ
ncbi:MAG: hydroxymethylglutaryl-CoA reductase, degradative [Candidatus Altiarchaeota archaeon]|nr:hydroxymethylglutaryl-CoA reductase, degradative [Candidatus Altiarchaeota archaeon]